MDIVKIVDFLQQYPVWFRAAAVVAIALLLIGLFTLRESKVEATISASSKDAPETKLETGTHSLAQFTLLEYFVRVKDLDGRFMELDVFSKGLAGKEVVWEGYVLNVRDQSIPTSSPIMLTVSPRAEDNIDLAAVQLPEEMRARALSFRARDFVRFKGVIVSTSPVAPVIKATTVELLLPKGGV